MITQSHFLEDACDVKDYVTSGSVGSILSVEPGTPGEFVLVGSEGDAEPCALSDHLFSCETSERTDPTARNMGFDADIVVRTARTGEFIDEDTLQVLSDVELDCEGSDCGILAVLLGNFPCALVLDMELAPSL